MSRQGYGAELPLVINELMASNSSGIQDPQGHYEDWIEIHNYGVEDIDVSGMYLTDDLSRPTQWQIAGGGRTGMIVPAGGYMIIWADGDTTDPGLHANFKLNSDGEEIGLFDRDGITLIDMIVFPDQTPNISYGRFPDAEDTWRFFATASPETRNDGVYAGEIAEVKFSHSRGFYNTPFTVTLATETEGAVIYYTLDGSEPYNASGRFVSGSVYTDQISISGTTCLRAKAVRHGFKPSNVGTHTYIFPADTIRKSQQQVLSRGYPSTWFETYPADYEMDPQVYNNPAYAAFMDDALLSIPTLSVVTDKGNLFSHERDPDTGGIYIYTGHSTTGGQDWERSISAEFFTRDGVKEFQVNCGLRIQGGEGRRPTKCPKHSFSLRFSEDYGPAKLDFDLFDAGPVNSFDTLQLRGFFNNAWTHWAPDQRARTQYIRDQWMRDSLIDMGQADAGQGSFVHLYLNGIYWGLYDLHERPVASHYAAYNGGDEDSLDAVNGGRATDGTLTAWNQMKTVVAGRNWEEICHLIDMDNFIDFTIVNLFAGNTDLKNNGNWRAAGGGPEQKPWHFYSWDGEHVLENTSQTGTKPSSDPTGLFSHLDDIEEFRVRFGDRVHKHLFNRGALTPEMNAQRWIRRADEIDLAVIAESARWGDYRRDMHSYSSGPYYLYTKNDFWLPEKRKLLDQYFPYRTNRMINQYRNLGLYPNVEAPVFRINGAYRHGGSVSKDRSFTMTALSGIIWYTLDGSDPRVPGKPRSPASISPAAIRYAGSIPLQHSVHVKARTLSGRTWSALNEAIFSVGPVAENLRISEIMYHPQAQPDVGEPNEEFIELTNIGTETINLNLVRFTNGINFTLPRLDLTPGEYTVVVQNRDAFEAHYGTSVNIAGEYTGRLNNAGERITLEDAFGQIILDFTYRDGWQSLTDGEGFSLILIDPANPDLDSWDDKDAWRSSTYFGGSPGRDDSGILPNPGDVVINELLANSPGGDPDWIELYNTTGITIDLGGWFLSDSNDNLFKYEIAPGTTIGPNEYLVFYQDLHFGNTNDAGSHETFGLSDNGERVILSSAQDGILTGYREVEDFGASASGVSFGRYTKSSTGNTNFVAMESPTPGLENAYPKVGPIVISEIMYNPDWPDGGSFTNDQYEYIELHNISAEPVTLYDSDTEVPWAFTRGIDFTFPTDVPVTIPAGEYLLVVKHPEAFMWRYPGVPIEMIIGPYDGKLSNAGESIELSMPGDIDKDGKPYTIRIDRVNYSDGSHPEDCPGLVDLWPVEPDGDGMVLTRKILADYGNDPDNWTAGAPSPAE
ncbi:lamin tail domain-containing protein [Planctomycetota bacterium]